MERARDGERFLITRRGRPHACLGPPESWAAGGESPAPQLFPGYGQTKSE
jgi:antitoxin (DNA-binding transcriptional repressor) of toxin-antitoxin stability system